MKYHEAQDALDMNMNVIDCGHFDTEDIFKDVMKRFIDGFEEFETIKSEVYLNPFKIIQLEKIKNLKKLLTKLDKVNTI